MSRLNTRLTIMVIAVVAAAPTVISARHAGFVADDWGFLRAATDGPNSWFVHGLDIRFRPIQAGVHWVMFEAFGGHPAPALLLMAVLEVAVALLLRRLLLRFVPERAAGLVALVWAALPNRSAPRLWISATPVTICVLLLLGAALAASGTRRRPVVAALLCCAAVLTYESGVLVGLLIIVWAWFDAELPRRDLIARLARLGVAYGAVVVWNVTTSPKAPSAPAASRSAVDGLVGAGLSPAALGMWATIVGLVVLGVAVVGSRLEPNRRAAFNAGALVTLAGLLPLLAVGASPVINGPVDRLNVIPVLGVAVVLGLGFDALVGRAPPIVLGLAGVALAVTFGFAQADDVSAVDAARRDAETTIAAFEHLPPDLADRHLVLDPGVGHRGWYAFGWDSARAAIALRTGVDVDLRDPPAGHLDLRPDETLVRVIDGRVVTTVEPRP